ncbi:MAG: hypothetical protein QOK02_3854 [Mycobacterium sp.]|nr:hypothetical protein [Mycobacterium sp.]
MANSSSSSLICGCPSWPDNLPSLHSSRYRRVADHAVEVASLTSAFVFARQGYHSVTNGFLGTNRPLEEDMTITGIITAILIGIVIGVLGRLVAPGKQNISFLVTILVGIVAAFIGTALARAIGIPTDTNGIDWLELLVQVIVAAVGVGLVSAMMGRRKSGLLRR